jgi:hypothetical protein
MSEKSEGAIDKEQSRNIIIMISLMDFLYLPDLILKLFMGVFIGAGGVKPFDSFLFELFPVNAGQKRHISFKAHWKYIFVSDKLCKFPYFNIL